MAEQTTSLAAGAERFSDDHSYPTPNAGTNLKREYDYSKLPPNYQYAKPIKIRPIGRSKRTESGSDDNEEIIDDNEEIIDDNEEIISHPITMNQLPSCYCGVISRSESERILKNQPVGTYLLRVSETRDGYTVSLRAKDRCKHFAVEENLENGKFVVVGEKPKFLNFNDLIRFYKVHPISPHGDLLQTPLKKQVLLDYFQNAPPTRIIPNKVD